MPVIGATELQPVNILGSYVQGLEGGRAARSQRLQEQAALVQAQREAELRNYLSTADLSSPEAQNQLLRYGKSGADIAKTLGEMGTQRLTRQKTELEIANEQRKAAKSKLEEMIGLLRGAVDEQSYQQRLSFAAQRGFDLSDVPPTFDKSWIDSTIGQLMPLKEQFEQEERLYQRGVKQQELGFRSQELGVSLANLGLRRSEQDLQREKFEREGDLGFQGRVEQMKAASKFKGEALAKAEADLPRAVDQAQATIDLIDRMIGKPAETDASGKVVKAASRPHPGFVDAVGATWKPGARFVPGTDAASFQAMYDQATGTAFLQAYETLRGGGQIANEEGKKATAAMTRMNLAQNEKEFATAAREFQDAIRTGVKNARVKAGKPAPVGASARTTAGGTSYEIIED
jgi:hypothetical protein